MMQKLSDISVIKDILSRHGFHFSKALGQNFLINPSVCPRIAELGGAREGVGVLEIGPGIGVLTVELAERASRVAAVEIDERLLPVLDETLAPFDHTTVIHGDILKLDLAQLIREQFADMPVVVCANLPYYITSPVLMALLEARLPIESITVLVQKEAADRLTAEPGTRAAGAVSVAVRYFSKPQFLFGVSRGSFLPAPKVDSAVIRLDIRQKPPVDVLDEAFFFRVARTGFAQRRKTAANSISATLGLPKQTVTDAMISAGIQPTARAEQLAMEQLAALADALLPVDGMEGEKR